MTDRDRCLLLHGSLEPLPPQRPLRAGPLSLIFEAGDLRYVTLGGREIVRRLYGAVRDREWRTVPGTVSGLRAHTGDDRFLIEYRSEHREGEIHFVWDARIEGSPDGRIVFDFSGHAVTSFERNRIGLCLLHPVRGTAGALAVARHTGGGTSQVRFPELVAIEQPIDGFRDLGALELDGGAVEFGLEGDAFETEDQRNWIDASYKTYSTPLSLPRPVRVPAGTRVVQRVTVRVRPRDAARVQPSRGEAIPALPPLAAPGGPMPDIGLTVGAGDTWQGTASALSPAHLRLDLDLTRAGWQPALERGAAAARTAGCPVEIALTLDPACEAALDRLVREWPDEVPIVRVLALAPGGPTTTAGALSLARAAFTGRGAAVGAGSRVDLYEFHLHPPPGAGVLFWPMNPQAHASDVTSLTETPEAAGDQVRSVRHRRPGTTIAISPVTIRPRGQRDAGGVQALHGSLLAASWTLAMAAHLASAGAGSVTFFEGLPDIVSAAGTPHPLVHVLADLCDCAGARVLAAPGGDADADGARDRPAALLVARGTRATLLAANLSRRARVLQVPPGFVADTCRLLDDTTAPRAASDPAAYRAGRRAMRGGASLELRPFATARLDGDVAPQ